MRVDILLLPLLLAQVIGFVFGIVMIVGAVKMMRLKSHGLATVASVLALLPCGPAWFLGLPMGIWSLVVLSRRDVKAAFRAKQSKTAPPSLPVISSTESHAAEAGKLMLQAPADALILAGCAAFLSAFGVGLWLWLTGHEGLSELARGNLVGMSVANAVYALVIIVAGLLMRRLSARLFTLVCVVIGGMFVPSVLALNVVMELKSIPQWPVLIPTWLGVPAAIWATVVLFRRDVRAAFQDQAASRSAAQKSHEVPLPPSAWEGMSLPTRIFIVVAMVVAGFVGKKLFFPDISEALWTVLLVMSIAAFLADVLLHRRRRQGLQALFALLAGLVAVLAYLITIPEQPLKGLYDFSGSPPGSNDVAATRAILLLIAAWLVYLMIHVKRKMRSYLGRSDSSKP